MKKKRLIMMLAILATAGAAMAQGNGQAGITEATQMVTSYFDPGTKHSDESGGQARCFWIGYSYNEQRFFNGSVAEVRIWNRALTAEEIQAVNHFYTADPASEGLIAYWKFDEGEGDRKSVV